MFVCFTDLTSLFCLLLSALLLAVAVYPLDHMCMENVQACHNDGPSGGSSVHTHGSEDPNWREPKFTLSNLYRSKGKNKSTHLYCFIQQTMAFS